MAILRADVKGATAYRGAPRGGGGDLEPLFSPGESPVLGFHVFYRNLIRGV